MKDVASAAIQSLGVDKAKHVIAVSTVAGGAIVEWVSNFPIGKLGVLAGTIYSMVMTYKVLQDIRNRGRIDKQEIKLNDIKIAKEDRREGQ